MVSFCNSLPLQLLVLPLILLIFKTPWQGAQTTIYCAVSENLEGVSGQFFGDCRMEQLKTTAATDDNMAEKLWHLSCKMVDLPTEGNWYS